MIPAASVQRETTPIPFECYDQHHSAVLGITGSGKTVTSKVMVEQLVAQGRHVCIIDPIKSDWFGLTSSRGGDSPGLPFTVLGGPRGAIPLSVHSGSAIGKLVGSGELQLSIVDMAKFHDPASAHQWFVAFAESLWEHLDVAVHIVLEEAHMWAPKERSIGAETMSTYWVKKLATGSRSKGVRLLACTQRTQRLHNDLLSSCRLIVGHQTIFPADRKPIVDWIKGLMTDQSVAAEVDRTLPGLHEGEAWVASASKPAFVTRMRLPMCETFDNSKTPVSGSKARAIKTSAVDVEAITRLLGDAVEEIKASDPKLLRAEVDRLKRELAAKRSKPITMHAGELGKAQDRIAELEAKVESLSAANQMHVSDRGGIAHLLTQAIELTRRSDHEASDTQPVQSMRPHVSFHGPGGNRVPEQVGSHREVQADDSVRPSLPGVRSRHASSGGKGASSLAGKDLREAHFRVLEAFLWYERLGQTQPSNAQLCLYLGYSPTASTISVLLSVLRRSGHVSDHEITDLGRNCVHLPDVGSLQDFHSSIRGVLSGGARAVFDLAVANRRRELSADEICKQCGWSRTSSTLSVALSELRRVGVMERRGHRLTSIVFPEGLR